MIERKDFMSFLCKWKDKKIIKVLTGIRRCGKSTMLKMFCDHLMKDGVKNEQIQYFNFEDIDNEPLLNYHALYSKINQQLYAYGQNYLLFDEIQMVNQFQKVIDSLFLRDNIDIYITGSNAYMLSGEIATLLSGRYVELKMYPLSYSEFFSAQHPMPSKEDVYRKYISLGGFPYILQIQDNMEMVYEYLSGLYNTIVVKDIMSRKQVTDSVAINRITRYLADNIGNLSAIKRISDTLTSNGTKISPHTVESYVATLVASYIFYPVGRYDIKGMQYLKTGQKYYLADMGLRQIIVGTKGGDLGHILENVVFLELLRRGGEIYTGKVGDLEVDFIVVRGNMKEYYQVALSVREEETLKRELTPLQKIDDYYPKYLLTLDNDPIVSHSGIMQINVLDWLLADYKKESQND